MVQCLRFILLLLPILSINCFAQIPAPTKSPSPYISPTPLSKKGWSCEAYAERPKVIRLPTIAPTPTPISSSEVGKPWFTCPVTLPVLNFGFNQFGPEIYSEKLLAGHAVAGVSCNPVGFNGVTTSLYVHKDWQSYNWKFNASTSTNYTIGSDKLTQNACCSGVAKIPILGAPTLEGSLSCSVGGDTELASSLSAIWDFQNRLSLGVFGACSCDLEGTSGRCGVRVYSPPVNIYPTWEQAGRVQFFIGLEKLGGSTEPPDLLNLDILKLGEGFSCPVGVEFRPFH